MRIQTVHKNYAQLLENYQLRLPIDLEIFIPDDDSVRLLSLMMEELDYKKLYEAYSPNGRNPAVPPKILFKILVYAYMNDIWSSRKIEIACKRDINFMWLLQGFKAPDHNTIARFRTGRLEPILDDLFNQFIITDRPLFFKIQQELNYNKEEKTDGFSSLFLNKAKRPPRNRRSFQC